MHTFLFSLFLQSVCTVKTPENDPSFEANLDSPIASADAMDTEIPDTAIMYSEISNSSSTEQIDEKTMKSLSLTNSMLKSVPEHIFEHENLEFLELQNNQLKTIPKKISKLKKLEFLDLQNNQLRKLPRSLEKMSSIVFLNLHDNRNIPNFVENENFLGRIELFEIFKEKVLINNPHPVAKGEKSSKKDLEIKKKRAYKMSPLAIETTRKSTSEQSISQPEQTPELLKNKLIVSWDIELINELENRLSNESASESSSNPPQENKLESKSSSNPLLESKLESQSSSNPPQENKSASESSLNLPLESKSSSNPLLESKLKLNSKAENPNCLNVKWNVPVIRNLKLKSFSGIYCSLHDLISTLEYISAAKLPETTSNEFQVLMKKEDKEIVTNYIKKLYNPFLTYDGWMVDENRISETKYFIHQILKKIKSVIEAYYDFDEIFEVDDAFSTDESVVNTGNKSIIDGESKSMVDEESKSMVDGESKSMVDGESKSMVDGENGSDQPISELEKLLFSTKPTASSISTIDSVSSDESNSEYLKELCDRARFYVDELVTNIKRNYPNKQTANWRYLHSLVKSNNFDKIENFIKNRTITLKESTFDTMFRLVCPNLDYLKISDLKHYWGNRLSGILGLDYPTSVMPDSSFLSTPFGFNRYVVLNTFAELFTPEYVIKVLTKEIQEKNKGLRISKRKVIEKMISMGILARVN